MASDKSSRFGGFFGEHKPRKDEKLAEKPVREEEPEETEETEEEIVTDSKIRQNFHPKIEEKLNKQINMALEASYLYRSMWIYFDSDDVALLGFSKFFLDLAELRKDRALEVMKYINRRGGSVILEDIVKPPVDTWGTGLCAMERALGMEKSLNKTWLELHKLTLKYMDPLTEEIIKKYLLKKVELIKKLADHVTNLTRVEDGVGVYVFDQKTLDAEDIVDTVCRKDIKKVDSDN